MLVFACIASIADAVVRVKASDCPSILSLHYGAEAPPGQPLLAP